MQESAVSSNLLILFWGSATTGVFSFLFRISCLFLAFTHLASTVLVPLLSSKTWILYCVPELRGSFFFWFRTWINFLLPRHSWFLLFPFLDLFVAFMGSAASTLSWAEFLSALSGSLTCLTFSFFHLIHGWAWHLSPVTGVCSLLRFHGLVPFSVSPMNWLFQALPWLNPFLLFQGSVPFSTTRPGLFLVVFQGCIFVTFQGSAPFSFSRAECFGLLPGLGSFLLSVLSSFLNFTSFCFASV